MLEALARGWWLFVVRGVCAVIFGVLALTWPGVTLAALVLLFGAYALVDGATALFAAVRGGPGAEHRGLLAIEGLLGLGIGLLTAFAPGVTAIGLLVYVAAWALATGVLEIALAIRLRKEIQGEFWLGLSGLASIGLAALLLTRPDAGIMAFVWMIAFYAILFGALLIVLGLRLRASAPQN